MKKRKRNGFRKYALVNPNWRFNGSIYFGCRAPHLPIEFGYAKEILEENGHEAVIFDAHLEDLSAERLAEGIRSFQPNFTVVLTAPTYLFWRCPQPELSIPIRICSQLRNFAGTLIAVGPHASTTPVSTIRKLAADLVIRGEFETVLPGLAGITGKELRDLPYIVDAEKAGQDFKEASGGSYAHECDTDSLPAIHWQDRFIRLHRHHHHRFDSGYKGLGAEIEASRGCPYQCSFCARGTFRNHYRKRPLNRVLEEIDGLLFQGVTYLYFIDEIFFPDSELIAALAERELQFGIQTRIDLWQPEMFACLGEAGCVSIEAGVESISAQGRKTYGRFMDDDAELKAKLISARKKIPFVQATLLDGRTDSKKDVAKWRRELIRQGVWVNEPVPVFPYPGSTEYYDRWGAPDDRAWERAHAHYLAVNRAFSDLQDNRPVALPQLERRGKCCMKTI